MEYILISRLSGKLVEMAEIMTKMSALIVDLAREVDSIKERFDQPEEQPENKWSGEDIE